MTQRTYRGCYTAIVTPFDRHGQFDETTMRDLVEWQITSGIDGLVVCGTTGESVTLDTNETERVMRTVIEQANGRVPVICGAGTNNTSDAIERTIVAESLGADGILSVAPYYNKPTQAGFIAHFEAIANAVSLPIILYNVPGRTGSNMKAETTLELARIPHIVAVKEASGNLEQVMQIIRDRPENFSVLSGDDALALPMIGAGADGVISVLSNEVPAQFTSLVHAALEGDFTTARDLQNRFLNLMQLNFIESNPIPAKTALALMGRVEEVFRLPLVPMETTTRDRLQNELEALGLLQQENVIIG